MSFFTVREGTAYLMYGGVICVMHGVIVVHDKTRKVTQSNPCAQLARGLCIKTADSPTILQLKNVHALLLQPIIGLWAQHIFPFMWSFTERQR